MTVYPADQIFADPDIVRSIADGGNTPFFLYHKEGICSSVGQLHNQFAWMEGYQNYFSIRENPNPQILKLLQKSGTGVCADSLIELHLAQWCGFHGAQLLYEPGRKDPEAETAALALNALWLCNSAALIPDVLPERLILRYNPMDMKLTPQMNKSVSHSKSGLSRRQLMDAAAALKGRGLEQIGIALQVSQYSISPGFWARKAELLFRLMKDLQKQTGLSVSWVHIGEGPGMAYHPDASSPDYPEEAAAVRQCWEKLPLEMRPVVLTGSSSRLMEPHGILVTKILEQRELSSTYLILDAGVCQFVRCPLKKAYRHVSLLGRSGISNRKHYLLAGELPVSLDRLAEKGRLLPRVVPGDYCVFHDMGSGVRSMAMLYGFHPVAGEYLYEDDGTVTQIAPRRTEEEVLSFLTAW